MLSWFAAGALLLAASMLTMPASAGRARLVALLGRRWDARSLPCWGLVWRWWASASPLPHRHRWQAVLATAVAVVGWALGGAVLAAVLVVAAVVGSRAVLRGRARRRADAVAAASVSAVAALTAELRAGRHPAQALRTVALSHPGAAGLTVAAAAASWGSDVAHLLESGTGGDACTRRALAAAWSVVETAGAAPADVLAAVESDLRSRADLRAETGTELAGSRATARVLAGLPVLGVALGAGLGAHPLHVLLHTPAGAVGTVLGMILEVAGLTWARRLAATAEQAA